MNVKELKEVLNRDGVVKISKLLTPDLLQTAQNAVDEVEKNPSAMAANYGMDKSSKDGRFISDFNNWRRIAGIEEVARSPVITTFIKCLIESNKLWFFHDHVLVKGGDAPETPWHQDRPYYLVEGARNVSIWIALSEVTKPFSLIFLKGSHRLKKMYAPATFKGGNSIGSSPYFETLSQTTIDRFKEEDKVVYHLSPGDALVFFHRTLHKSNSNTSQRERKALSLRYLGDGARLTKRVINATPPFDRMGLVFKEGDPIPEKWFPLV